MAWILEERTNIFIWIPSIFQSTEGIPKFLKDFGNAGLEISTSNKKISNFWVWERNHSIDVLRKEQIKDFQRF